jgi:hypothetical protein
MKIKNMVAKAFNWVTGIGFTDLGVFVTLNTTAEFSSEHGRPIAALLATVLSVVVFVTAKRERRCD